MTAPTTTATTLKLNRHDDRCDRCQAQAFTAFQMPSGSTLMFCTHHGREYKPNLLAQGASQVADEADEINLEPSPSANHF